jgi:mono/diheme cytochrome c family protein
MHELSRAGRCAGLLVLGLVLAAWAAAHGAKNWVAPEEVKKLKNPVPATDASLAAAKSVYLDKCAQCHGEEGKGDGPEAPMYDVKPADFADARMMGEMTDGEIFWKISEGRRPMPTFKKQFTEEQRWQLVNYVRSFAAKPAAAKKASAPPPSKKP